MRRKGLGGIQRGIQQSVAKRMYGNASTSISVERWVPRRKLDVKRIFEFVFMTVLPSH